MVQSGPPSGAGLAATAAAVAAGVAATAAEAAAIGGIAAEATLYGRLAARAFEGQEDLVALRERCLAEDVDKDLAPLLARVRARGGECAGRLRAAYCDRATRLADPKLADFPRECNESLDFAEGARRIGLPNTTRFVAAGASARLAVLSLVSRNPGVAIRALRALWRPGDTYEVHVDVRFPEARREVEAFSAAHEGAASPSEVRVFSAMAVHRGGPSLLRAELLGLERLLERSSDWQYFLYLSDSDYPLAPPDEIGYFLLLHWPMSFVPVVYAFGSEEEAPQGRRLVVGRPDLPLRSVPSRRWVFECGGHAYSILPELDYPSPPGQLPGVGSFSVALERGFAAWLVGALRSPRRSLARRVFSDEVSLGQPDESFFQALLLNSEWCNRHIQTSLHFSWVDSADKPSYALADSDIAALSPAVVVADSPQGRRVRELLGAAGGLQPPNQSTPGLEIHRSFFVRKVLLPDSASLLDEADQVLLGAAAAAADGGLRWRRVAKQTSTAAAARRLAGAWFIAGGASVGEGFGWEVLRVEAREALGGAAAFRLALRRRSGPGPVEAGGDGSRTGGQDKKNARSGKAGAAAAWLEFAERLALPRAAPTDPRRLWGRALLLRVVAEDEEEGSRTSVSSPLTALPSVLPAGARGIAVEASLSPAPRACRVEARWFDPRGRLRAVVPAWLAAWQAWLRVSYPGRRGPARAGEWRVELAEVGETARCWNTIVDRTFYIYARGKNGGSSADALLTGPPPPRVPLAELVRYFDFDFRASGDARGGADKNK